MGPFMAFSKVTTLYFKRKNKTIENKEVSEKCSSFQILFRKHVPLFKPLL